MARTPLDAYNVAGSSAAQVGIAAGGSLRIYIEGDGRAWIDRTTPSLDPTPQNPLALKLAIADPSSQLAYLARPCQFNGENESSHCEPRYWTNERFSAEVIGMMDVAVSQLKAAAAAEKIELVGFSGGGAVAALIAARRNDVKLLVTVAGVLDHKHWTELQRVSPLAGSLNPIDELDRLADVKQLHFVGVDDRIVQSEVARNFVEQAASPRLN